MALTKIEISNNALSTIGERAITDFYPTESTERARVVTRRYAEIRDSLLRSHPWNFSTKRVALSATVTAPAFGFDYAYPLPSDYLRVLGTDDEGYEWQIEAHTDGSAILVTNRSNIPKIKYIYKNDTPSTYDSLFTQAFVYRLGADLSQHLTGRPEIAKLLMGTFIGLLAEARSTNASEGTPQKIEADLWLAARQSGITLQPFAAGIQEVR
tara:strand:- start:274 stop:906 length:633 start_codon:yes stop_codon:yes gene_type:complete